MPHMGTPALLAIGDSLTYNDVYGVPLEQHHPHRTAALITAAGGNLTPYNYGLASEGSAACATRAASIVTNGSPEIAIIWTGTNDSLTSTTTHSNIMQIAATLNATKTLIVGNHFINYAAGHEMTAQIPRWRRLRLKQKRAAEMGGYPYMDLYLYMKKWLTANPAQQGNDALWNVGTGNAHLNAAGEQMVANAIYDKIKSLGWVP